MKRSLLRGLAAFTFALSAHSLSAQDLWTPTITGGFGDHYNIINCMHVFKGNIYAGTGDDSAAIYSSSTGNMGTWVNKYSAGYVIYGIKSFASTTEGGGYMFAGTSGSGTPPSQVLRTADGNTWDVMYNANYQVTHIIPFKGLGTADSIYVIENNYSGDIISRAAYNSNDPDNLSGSWTQVFSFSGTYENFNCWQVFNGKLFMGTDNGNIYTTADGTHWQQDPAVTTGFGDGNNSEISAMGTFNGYLYAATYNNSEGTQIWRTNDDVTWTQVSQFASYQRITSIVANGTSQLWIALNNGDGGQGAVFKSADGLVFSVSENNGFGVNGDDGQYAQLQVFGNNIYCSTQNYPTGGVKIAAAGGAHTTRGSSSGNGGEVWRVCSGTPPVVDLGPDQTICAGASVTLNGGTGVHYNWSHAGITDTTQMITAMGSPAGINYTLYITDAMGCTGVDMITIKSNPLPTIAVVTPYPQNVILCPHDSIELFNQGYSNYRLPQPEMHYTPANDSIYDNQSSYDTVTVSGIDGIAPEAIMTVTIDSLYHTYDGDLTINLHAPDGSLVTLSNQNGDSGDNYIGTVFSALSMNDITTSGAPFTGTFAPQGGFNSLSGPANGQWVMEVTDNATGDQGILKGWSMQFSVADTVLTFSWTPSTGLSSATIASPELHPVGGNTIYTLTATNDAGCSAQISDTINVPVIHITTADDSICAGSSTILTASGAINPVWGPAATLSSTMSMNVSASPTAASTLYYVTDTVTGCFVTDSITIRMDTPFSTTITPSVTICAGDSTTIVVTPAGGSAPYHYSWTDGNNTASEAIAPATTTNYFVSTTDAFGCTQSNSTIVTIRPSTDIYGHISYSGGAVANSNVVIYRYEPYLVHFDTVLTTATNASGDYHFTAVPHHNYLIEVFPGASYTSLVPSYYGNVFLWDSATIVMHDCVMPDTFNIAAVENTSFGSGPGYLHGRIIKDEGFAGMGVYHAGHERAPGEPIPGIDVKLGHNPGGQLVATTMTNGTGDYEFSNVAYGNYTVYVDIPGLGRDSSYTFTVDSTNYFYNYLDYTVDSTMIRIVPDAGVGVNDLAAVGSNKLSVYPNPSKGDATVQYTLDREATVSLGVYNVLGVKVKAIAQAHQQSGTYRYSMSNDGSLDAGAYFVTLIADGKTSIQRIIITE